MLGKKLHIIFIIFILTPFFCQIMPVKAQFSEGTSLDAVYALMTESATKGNYEEISALLPSVSEATNKIKKNFNVDIVSEIRDALVKRDKEKVLSAVNKLIFYDMKNIFFEISQMRKASATPLRMLMKKAYSNYRLLSPEIRSVKSKADDNIKMLFKQLFSFLAVETSPFAVEKRDVIVDADAIHSVTVKIEEECLSVLR
ncbi:MAG: hypothetical protein AB1610_04550 [Nitrospirota bacterium]